ncbi:MAG: pseudouridine synthase, partial [Acidobacteria bacterium]|nr:pseudouridine synthase [Acidobacteriota bacterium]
MTAERLQKLIAAAGIASRRSAERMIAEGRVTVDGEVVRVPGVRADPALHDIRVDGARLRGVGKPRRYLILNKPIGHLTTRSDPGRRSTVMDLLPHSFRSLVPVGRLDGNSSGLVLLTDDGELAQRVTHPRYRLPKTYYATVRGLPGEDVLERAQRGIRVDGEGLRLDQVEVIARFPHRAESKR